MGHSSLNHLGNHLATESISLCVFHNTSFLGAHLPRSFVPSFFVCYSRYLCCFMRPGFVSNDYSSFDDPSHYCIFGLTRHISRLFHHFCTGPSHSWQLFSAFQVRILFIYSPVLLMIYDQSYTLPWLSSVSVVTFFSCLYLLNLESHFVLLFRILVHLVWLSNIASLFSCFPHDFFIYS